ncbi:MAG: RpiB/LacA/LacB family sugar-phosphate isomerase [Bacteroidales bacterium]|jgi:ribose 5-phosphate isomerase B|nr:RpiB/LacA/LacB family sugar-phosphate isomerase [Bacteroidales bacterium]
MKILIAADHAGFELKEFIKKNFSEEVEWIDFGTFSTESIDYPDLIHPLAKEISLCNNLKGVIICGSANGVAMTANKHPNVRAAICWKKELAILARQHNNANVIALPARFIDENEALNIVKTFFNTDFEGGRHQNRIDKINIV